MGQSSSLEVTANSMQPRKFYLACTEEIFELWRTCDLMRWSKIQDQDLFLAIANLYCRHHLMDQESQSQLARHLPWPHTDAKLMHSLLSDAEKFKPLLCYTRVRALGLAYGRKFACDELEHMHALETLEHMEFLPEDRNFHLLSFIQFCKPLNPDKDNRFEIQNVGHPLQWGFRSMGIFAKHSVTKLWRKIN